MQLMVMTFVTDMANSVAFYESLGLLRKQSGEIDQFGNEFAIGDATLALHHSTPEEIPPVDKHLQVNFNIRPVENWIGCGMCAGRSGIRSAEISTIRDSIDSFGSSIQMGCISSSTRR